ncbi:hypothetical protein CEXT_613541 [Caerostris extrusa]|uniref:Uncharacterized protein n=1 Tax=Caerostris extrusa TaxID=172846 RepID=A0AAV4XBU9_CAEEX|nr:hypothetical protein CEXT_613541 [Caerostris extrusa]
MYPDIFSRRINGSAVPEFAARYSEGALFHYAGSHEAAPSGWDLCYEFSRELALIRLLTVLTEACDWTIPPLTMKLLTTDKLPTQTKSSVNKRCCGNRKGTSAHYTATEIITPLPEDTKLPPGEVEHPFLPLILYTHPNTSIPHT